METLADVGVCELWTSLVPVRSRGAAAQPEKPAHQSSKPVKPVKGENLQLWFHLCSGDEGAAAPPAGCVVGYNHVHQQGAVSATSAEIKAEIKAPGTEGFTAEEEEKKVFINTF